MTPEQVKELKDALERSVPKLKEIVCEALDLFERQGITLDDAEPSAAVTLKNSVGDAVRIELSISRPDEDEDGEDGDGDEDSNEGMGTQ